MKRVFTSIRLKLAVATLVPLDGETGLLYRPHQP